MIILEIHLLIGSTGSEKMVGLESGIERELGSPTKRSKGCDIL